MFEIGWAELLIIGIVLILVVGPKELPGMLRTFGRTTAKLRAMAGDFRKQFDDAIKEAELDEVKNLAAEARKLDPTAEIRKNLDPMKKMGEQIKTGLDNAVKTSPPVAATGTSPVAGGPATPAAAGKDSAAGAAGAATNATPAAAPAPAAPASAEAEAAKASPAPAAVAGSLAARPAATKAARPAATKAAKPAATSSSARKSRGVATAKPGRGTGKPAAAKATKPAPARKAPAARSMKPKEPGASS